MRGAGTRKAIVLGAWALAAIGCSGIHGARRADDVVDGDAAHADADSDGDGEADLDGDADADADEPRIDADPPECPTELEVCDGLDDDGDGAVDEGCACRDAWVYEMPAPYNAYFVDVWAAPDGRAFAVGVGGVIAAYDGAAWTAQPSGTFEHLNSVWGIGYEAFAVGWGGVIVHYDGCEWSPMESGVEVELNGVWAAAPDDVYAVGEAGTVLHYDGASWRTVPVDRFEPLNAVWGSGPSDVIVVGHYGLLMRFDGAAWTVERHGADGSLYAVWGTGPDDVFAAGDRAVHFDGTEWTRVHSPDLGNIRDLWGSNGSDVYAAVEAWDVNGGGMIYHYDGTDWRDLRQRGITLTGVSGSGPDDVVAVGDRAIRRFDGTAWAREDGPWWWGFEDVWAASPREVIAVGYGMTAEEPATGLFYDGRTWTAMPTEVVGDLHAVWGLAVDDVFAVGGVWDWHVGVVGHWDGHLWQEVMTTEAVLWDLWGSGPADLFAVGMDGLILHYDGLTWAEMDSGTDFMLLTVWGRGPDDIYVGGGAEDTGHGPGIILHYDGAAWSTVWEGDRNINALWGAEGAVVIAVGNEGRAVHFDGAAWTEQPTGTTEFLWSVWGTGPDDVYAFGRDPRAIHWDGTRWSQSSLSNHLGGRLWRTSASNVFVAPSYGIGALHHCGGTAWP